jgi:hypothetical protein
VAISFPTSLDNFTNPSSGNTLDSPSHSLQHSDINDAVEAMQRKVGVGTAVAGSASAGQVLTISAAGTSTWSTPAAPGLVLLNTQSFSAVTSVSLPTNTFTSTYENYRILIKLDSITGTNPQFGMRFRASGTDQSGSNYYSGGFLTYRNGTPASFNDNPQTYVNLGQTNTASYTAATIDLFAPNLAKMHNYLINGTNADSTALLGFTKGGTLDQTVAYDSVTFFVTAGNLAGTLYVYGYSK